MSRGRHAKLSRWGRWRLNRSHRFTRRRFLIGAAAFMALISAGSASHWLPALAGNPSRTKPGQTRRLLNGVWDFQPASYPLGDAPLSGQWAKIRVPSEWNMTAPPNFATSWGAYDIWETPAAWDEVDAAWYRTYFKLPSHPNGLLKIRFDAVNFAAFVYVNGHLVGEHYGGTVPFTVDATEWVHPGVNTLWVAVAGPKAIRTPGGFPYPMGSWWGQLCGGIWQDVWLIEQDPLEISDLRLQTSTRRQRLSLQGELSNHGPQREATLITLSVWDGSQLVFRQDHHLTIPPGTRAAISWTQTWPDAHWWNADDPYLYYATIDVRVDNRVRESVSLRFGFREVWVAGDRLYLNGQPLRLFGDEWHYFGSLENNRQYAHTWYRMAKAAHVNYIRLHAMPYPPLFYDVADEVGMLIVAESAIYGSSKNLDLTDPAFWVHAKEHLIARVRRDRHHPSIILWSAENEVLLAYGLTWVNDVAALKQPILSQDRTRPIYFEGDGDPDGVADLISWHYPLEITTAPALPHSFYAFARGGSQYTRWKRQKPLMISEFGLMWKAGPKLLSVVTGNAPFHDIEGLWSANAMITRAQIEGFRAAGVTGVTPWNLVWYGNQPLPYAHIRWRYPSLNTRGPKPLRVGRYADTLNPGWTTKLPAWRPNALHQAISQSFRARAAFNRQWGMHAFAQSTLQRTITVHNDTADAAAFTLTWRWTGGGQQRQAHVRLQLEPLGRQNVDALLPLPAVSTPTEGTWEIVLAGEDGSPLVQTSRPLILFPHLAPIRGTVQVVVPAYHTVQSLRQQGLTVVRWDGSSVDAPIIVGENTLPNAALWNTLLQAAARNAHILVLSQPPRWSNASGFSVDLMPVTRTFVQAPHNPILHDLTDDDLSWWEGPGETVAPGLLNFPDSAQVFILANGGEAMANASLVRWIPMSGAGPIWFCQYPIVSRIAQEPLAQRLLARLVPAVAQPVTERALACWGTALGTWFGTTPTDSIPSTSDLLLIDLADPVVQGRVANSLSSLRAWVAAGGRLWLHGGSIKPALVRSLTGQAAQAVQVPSRLGQGALNLGQSALTDGISNAVLDWSSPTGEPVLVTHAWRNVPASAQLINTVTVNWQDYHKPEQIKTASVLMSGGWPTATVVWASALQKGTIVIDELQWDNSTSLASTLRNRILAALSTV